MGLEEQTPFPLMLFHASVGYFQRPMDGNIDVDSPSYRPM